MSQSTRLVALYAVFSGIAILINLGTQALSIAIYSGAYGIALSMGAGTGAGLLAKYVLDKRHIFAYESDNLAHDGRLFILYSMMGLVTTALFWAVEYAFQWLFGNNAMRYLGGGIGLLLGYAIKYRLDKHFVFVANPTAEAG